MEMQQLPGFIGKFWVIHLFLFIFKPRQAPQNPSESSEHAATSAFS